MLRRLRAGPSGQTWFYPPGTSSPMCLAARLRLLGSPSNVVGLRGVDVGVFISYQALDRVAGQMLPERLLMSTVLPPISGTGEAAGDAPGDMGVASTSTVDAPADTATAPTGTATAPTSTADASADPANAPVDTASAPASTADAASGAPASNGGAGSGAAAAPANDAPANTGGTPAADGTYSAANNGDASAGNQGSTSVAYACQYTANPGPPALLSFLGLAGSPGYSMSCVPAAVVTR